MSQYSLIESFHIDHGELDGLPPQQCFALGVEWQKYWQFTLNHDTGIEPPPGPHLLNAANLKRVQALLEKHSVPYRLRQSHADWYEVLLGDCDFPEATGGDNGDSSA